MIGNVFKYVIVMAVGAAAFSTMAHCMDLDVVNIARVELKNKLTSLGSLPEAEQYDQMESFFKVKRPEWIEQLTFVSSIREIDGLYGVWRL